MMSTGKTQPDFHGGLSPTIKSGVNYLFDHQYPNGEFCCYYAPDDRMLEWCVPDSTIFPTALIASCLLNLRDDPKVAKLLSSSSEFLRYQMMTGGVWNYFTRWNPLFPASPADVDDTAFASFVLRSLGYTIPDNRNHLLANRNSKGLFYTWFVTRRTKFKYINREYLKIMFREFKRPLHTLLFWCKHEASRADIDGVVNANALFYIGVNDETVPVVNYLIDIVTNFNEKNSDNWYKNPFTFYYFLSRNYKSVKDFERIKNIIIERIQQTYNIDGSYNSSALETALAISTLLNFNYAPESMTKSVQFLLDSQKSPGCWDRHILFYSGKSKTVGWGSEEICTAFCIEALQAYRKFLESESDNL